MSALDPLTLDRVAELIVDIGGPYERKGYQLEALLQRAKWIDPPIYDGSPRVPWLRDQFEARQQNSGELERLLCRVCDPIEYDEGAVIANEIRAAVNDRLAPEHLVVTLVGGRPVLGEIGSDGHKPTFSEPPDLRRRLEMLVADTETVDVLMGRVEETRICATGGAYRMATIGVGTFIEGLLLAVLLERDEDLRINGFPDVRQRISPTSAPPSAARRIGCHWNCLSTLPTLRTGSSSTLQPLLTRSVTSETSSIRVKRSAKSRVSTPTQSCCAGGRSRH